MKAYTLEITKEQFVNQIKKHQELDHFIKDIYSEGDRGCAVGCLIKSINIITGKELETSNYQNYEKYLGIPEWLARVEDNIFKGLNIERAKKWPLEFSEAINISANLDEIKIPFIVFILKSNLVWLDSLKDRNNKKLRNSINLTIDVTKQMIEAQMKNDAKLITLAKSAAWSAACSEESVKFAAESAAWSVESAVWSAARSVESAAWSAVWSAETAVWSAAYERFADKLIELLKECK